MSKILTNGELYDFLYSQRKYTQQAGMIWQMIVKHFALTRDRREIEIINSNNSSKTNIFEKNLKETQGVDEKVNVKESKREEKEPVQQSSKQEKKAKKEKKKKEKEAKRKEEKKSKKEGHGKESTIGLNNTKGQSSILKKESNLVSEQRQSPANTRVNSPPAKTALSSKVLTEPKETLDVLDLACGTGLHLKALSKYARLKLFGLDMDETLLTQAKRNAPKASYFQADMVDFQLPENKQFDVILCMFSAIGYARTFENLKAILRNIRRHLKEGGLVLLEPWFCPDAFREGLPNATLKETESLKVVRMGTSTILKESTKLGDDHVDLVSRLHFDFLVTSADQPGTIEHFQQTHHLGLFTREQYIEAFQNSGIQVRFSSDVSTFDSRGLFIGRDRAHTKHHIKYCKLVCTSDWTTQLNYLVERGWNIVEFLWETESQYRELDDYGKRLANQTDHSAAPRVHKLTQGLGIGWYDIRTQCILLEKEEEEVDF